MEAMKTDLSDEELKLIVEALEHYYAYTRATQRDDSRYQELADKLKKKGSTSVSSGRSASDHPAHSRHSKSH
jgi:hypothetical protein